ncbi:MAG: MsnO8 family LLM class oxidoreductase, partial [Stellaceae bacterium]
MILSVLDQSPVRAGGTASDALNETIQLAQAAERWGYHRYWLAEHHATEGLAGAAPEIMIARVAAATSEIRVGSGGVMLSHYSPLKVAEQFRVLETLYPGRIDLGIGRAPGSDRLTAQALAHGPGALGIEHFPQ